MTSNVLQFPNTKTSHTDKRREAISADARKVARAMGRNVRIPPAERKVIAIRLDDEIEHSGVARGDLCSRPEADLTYGPKQLDKMLWRQGNREGKELLAFSAPYLKVIKALARCSKQDYWLLLDRVLVGTSLHRLNAASGALEEIEKTLLGLETAASQVSQALGLFDQFRETLRLKCEGFARGELDDWPYYPVSGFEAPSADDHAAATGEVVTDERVEWQERLEGARGFWFHSDGPSIEGLDLDMLGYMPHAYLGILETWVGWGLPKDREERSERRRELAAEYARVPTAIFNEGQLPKVVNTGEAACGSPLSVHDFLHSWLILYPDPAMSGIVPVLLTLDPTVGTFIELIDKRVLLELRRVIVIEQHLGAYDSIVERHPSAYDRVVELLAPPPGDKSLVEHWTETGRWFRHNPVLGAEARRVEARARRDRLFALGATDEPR